MVQTVCSFVNNPASSLRQAASYGVGVIAQSSGDHFAPIMDTCLQALKAGIELQPTAKVTEKKAKLTQFHHARDNAIASLGKIVKFRQDILGTNPEMAQGLIQYWLNCLPISHDLEECFGQFEFLADFVTT